MNNIIAFFSITDVISFNILAPSGPPLNCRATNISSHTVTLSWDMPVKASQNGDILSYNITCYNNDQVIASIKSIQMSISVPDLEPFTDYVCTIAAINVLGEGPTNNKCVFKTKEDGKLNILWLELKCK